MHEGILYAGLSLIFGVVGAFTWFQRVALTAFDEEAVLRLVWFRWPRRPKSMTVPLSQVLGVEEQVTGGDGGQQLSLVVGFERVPLIGWYRDADLRAVRAFLEKRTLSRLN